MLFSKNDFLRIVLNSKKLMQETKKLKMEPQHIAESQSEMKNQSITCNSVASLQFDGYWQSFGFNKDLQIFHDPVFNTVFLANPKNQFRDFTKNKENYETKNLNEAQVLLFDEDKHNIISIFNSLDEGRGAMVVNGDPCTPGGGLFDRACSKLKELIDKAYPEFKGKELFEIPHGIVKDVWETNKTQIRADLCKNVVSSEENVCLSSNFFQLMIYHLREKIYFRQPTAEGMKLPGQENCKGYRLKSPFCGTKQLEALRRKYPLFFDQEISDGLMNQFLYSISGVTMFSDEYFNELEKFKDVTMIYLVGIWPDIEAKDFNFDDITARETYLFTPFRNLIRNLFRTKQFNTFGELCETLYMSPPGGRYNFLKNFDKENFHSNEFRTMYTTLPKERQEKISDLEKSLSNDVFNKEKTQLIERLISKEFKSMSYPDKNKLRDILEKQTEFNDFIKNVLSAYEKQLLKEYQTEIKNKCATEYRAQLMQIIREEAKYSVYKKICISSPPVEGIPFTELSEKKVSNKNE